MDILKTRYAKTSDGVYIAYQVLGDGPMDLLYLPGYTSNLFWQWELPSYARFLEQLASFSRLILVDRRGTGLSDRFSPQDLPPLEDLADDLEIVMDAVGSERIALLGTEDGCFVCSMFAATHPERTDAIVLYGMPGVPDPERAAFREEVFGMVDEHWGTRDYARWDMKVSHPSLVDDEAFLVWYEVFLQLAASPTSAKGILEGRGLRERTCSASDPRVSVGRVMDGILESFRARPRRRRGRLPRSSEARSGPRGARAPRWRPRAPRPRPGRGSPTG